MKKTMTVVTRETQTKGAAYVSENKVLFKVSYQDNRWVLKDFVDQVTFVSHTDTSLSHWLQVAEVHIRSKHGFEIRTKN